MAPPVFESHTDSSLDHSSGSGKPSESLWLKIRRFRESDGFLLFVVSFITLTDNLIYGVILPFLPIFLHERAGVEEEQLQLWIWIAIASFALAQILCCALAALAVIYIAPPRTVMFVSLISLIGAIVLYSFATSPLMIVVARFAQGASNGVVNVVSTVILIDRLGTDNYGKAFGYIGMATASGCVTGPVFGGVFYQLYGSTAVFVATAALVGICTIFMVLAKGPRHQKEERASEPAGGGDEETQPLLPSSSDANGKKGATKIFNLRLSINFFGLILSPILPVTLDTILPLQAQRLFGWNALQTGFVFLAIVPGSLLGPYIGNIGDRYGAKLPLVLTCFFATCVILPMAGVLHDTVGDVVLLYLSCLAGGLVEPALFSLCGSEIANVVEKGLGPKYDSRSRVVWSSVVVNYGSAMGAFLGPVIAGNARDQLGWIGANVVVASVFAVGGLVFWITL